MKDRSMTPPPQRREWEGLQSEWEGLQSEYEQEEEQWVQEVKWVWQWVEHYKWVCHYAKVKQAECEIYLHQSIK